MINELTWIGVAVLSAEVTYWVHTRFKISPILASSTVALVVALSVIPLEPISADLIEPIPYAGLGGTFIGMSIRKKVKGYGTVFIAGIIFGIIFSRSSQFFEGFGGALGISACIAVLTAISLRKIFKRVKITVKKPNLSSRN